MAVVINRLIECVLGVEDLAGVPKHATAKFAAHFLMPARAVHATVAQLGVSPDEWTYTRLLHGLRKSALAAW